MNRVSTFVFASLFAAFHVSGCAQSSPESAKARGDSDSVKAETGQSGTNLFVNPGFEDAGDSFAPWVANMHADSESFEFALDSKVAREGKSSIRIERRRNEPFANIVQHFRGDALKAQRYRVSFWLRGQELTAPAYIHVVPFAFGSQAGLIDNRDKGLSGTFDWTQVTLDVELPTGTSAMEVGVTTTGDGILWVDGASVVALTE